MACIFLISRRCGYFRYFRGRRSRLWDWPLDFGCSRILRSGERSWDFWRWRWREWRGFFVCLGWVGGGGVWFGGGAIWIRGQNFFLRGGGGLWWFFLRVFFCGGGGGGGGGF